MATVLIPLVAIVSRPGDAAARRAAEEIILLLPDAVDAVKTVPGRLEFTACVHEDDQRRPSMRSVGQSLREAKLVDAIHVCIVPNCNVVLTEHDPTTALTELNRILSSTTFSSALHHALSCWRSMLRSCASRGEGIGPVQKERLTFKCVSKRARANGKTLVSSQELSRTVGGVLEEAFTDVFVGADFDQPDVHIAVSLTSGMSLPLFYRGNGASVQGSWQVGAGGLHPSVAWAVAKSLEIQAGDIILDPMCGHGNVLIEAGLNWSSCELIGCDINPLQIEAAANNVRRSNLLSRMTLLVADAGYCIPLRPQSVDKVCVDLPFGKIHGTVEENQSLYPRIFLEMARVVRCNGQAVVLTNANNEHIVRACLASVCEGGLEANREPDALEGAWAVTSRFSFMLFTKMRARVYLLQRTEKTALPPLERVLARSRRAIAALSAHDVARKRKYNGEEGWAIGKPTLFVSKLDGKVLGRLPWDTGNGSWAHQWTLERASMVPFPNPVVSPPG
jgi:ubiquinone/menaquinone biosynthesis C-methylase UbiE